MKTWWQGQSDRERLMILLAGGLLLVLLFVQLIFLPLNENYGKAKRGYARMANEHVEIKSRLRDLSKLDGDETSNTISTNQNTESLELLISRSASADGLRLARLQPSRSGLTVWVDAVDPIAFMSWAMALEERDGLKITKSSLTMREDGSGLRGNIEISKVGA